MTDGGWRRAFVERLASGAQPDGGWGYRSDTRSSAEATALAALALSAHDEHEDLRVGGLSYLAETQGADGAVSVSRDLGSPCWPTAMAIIAWLRAGVAGTDAFVSHARRGVDWLLSARGIPIAPDPRLFGHDTTLTGWSWAPNTHSWVEPTSYAVLALKAGARGDHARVTAGVRLLRDRALTDGGWNYGNTRVLDNTLRPFPATTGVALAALSGDERSDLVQAAIDYLTQELRQVRSPFSLGWGLIGLDACGEHPDGAEEWMAESASRSLGRRPNYLDDAVLLMSAARRCPVTAPLLDSKA